MVIESNLEYEKKTIFDLNKKVLNYLQIAMFSGGQKIYKREE